MEKISKDHKRNGCLPNPRSMYPWNREGEKKEMKAEEVTELVTVRIEDKSYECGSSIASKKRKKEIMEEKTDQEVVAEMFKDKAGEDGEFKGKSLVHEQSDQNKKGSLREQEVVAGEEEEMPYNNSLAFDESLKVVETQKNDNSDEKLKVEQGSESVDVDKPALPNFGAPSKEDLEQSFKPCGMRRRGAMNDAFSKVKTFDLRGVIKSSEKGLKAIPWSRLFSDK